ncbi:MAG: GAF domain-containing protein [Candidatus Cloacimonetes bacterium]|nr:GAF domain-containing protein [Candidatus Cloacimonadota bacterium]
MDKTRKAERYLRIYGQLREMLKKCENPIARMATIVAILHHKFEDYFWTGFYRLLDDKLTITCYQGPVACQVLAPHTGVCWASIDQKKTQIVEDVNRFPGHIACDSRTLSEITVPVYNEEGRVVAVLDVDSREFDAFDEIDAEWLEKIVELIYMKN